MLVNPVGPCYLYRSEALIDQALPIDVFKVLLSYFDTNASKSVSKYWYTSTLSMVKDLNIYRLSKVCSNLKEEISPCESFLELQAAILKMRDKAVEILKLLSDDELDKRECEPWMFFGHTIKLTKVCKAMDSARTLIDIPRDRALGNCVVDLVSMHMNEKAIGVVTEMQDLYRRQESFNDITSIFTTKGKFACAIEIQLTKMISGDFKTDVSIENTALTMSRAGQIPQAKKHIEHISDPESKDTCDELIEIMDLCQQNKFKEAESLADTGKKNIKSDAYLEISRELHRAGHWEECLRVTDAIPSPASRELGLYRLKIQIKDDKAKFDQVVKLLGENSFYDEL